MKRTRFVLISALLLLAVSFLSINACSYITGEALNPEPSLPRWVWSGGDIEYAIVITRNTQQSIKESTPEEAFGIIGTSEYLGNPVIIDVRTPSEYAGGHIRDAVNINLNSAAFENDIDKLDKDKNYIVYCQAGGRSAAARKIMEELGFKHVINMNGGISVWISQGLPVVK